MHEGGGGMHFELHKMQGYPALLCNDLPGGDSTPIERLALETQDNRFLQSKARRRPGAR